MKSDRAVVCPNCCMVWDVDNLVCGCCPECDYSVNSEEGPCDEDGYSRLPTVDELLHTKLSGVGSIKEWNQVNLPEFTKIVVGIVTSDHNSLSKRLQVSDGEES